MRRLSPSLDPAALTAALAQTRAPLSEARTLTPEVYLSPEVFAFEQRELFGRMWLCIGREEQLAEPRAFLTHEQDGERLLVVRGDDGELRAFFNVCRHRAARLVDAPSGRLGGAINCPYHKWSYALDGRLLHAPRPTPELRCADYPLLQARVETLAGFVFIKLDDEGPSLAEAMAELPELDRYGVAELRLGHRHAYTVAANWKVLAENYGECYHCQLLHPQLHRLSDFESGAFMQGACFNGGPMRLREGFNTLSSSGQTELAPLPGLDGERLELVHYNQVYPNLTLALHPQYVLTHALWPLAVDRTRVVCEWLFRPEALAAPGFDAGEFIEFWDLTNEQDWTICEGVQRGLASRGCVPGPYHPTERCVYAFDQWYASALARALSTLEP